MADLTLGATSLLLQLFETVIKGYNLFQCAANADSVIKTFVLRLRIEKCRLSRWGELSGLSGSDKSETYTRHLGVNEALTIDLLKQIKTALDSLGRLAVIYDSPSIPELESGADLSATRTLDISGPPEPFPAVRQVYGELVEAGNGEKIRSAPPKHPRGLNHLFRLAEDVFVVSKEPKRLVWAIKDQEHFRTGLDKLRILTDHLHETVSDDQMNQLSWWSHETWLSILQLSITVEDMKVLLAAQQEMSHHDTGPRSKSNSVESQLQSTIERVTSFAIKTSSFGRKESMLLRTQDLSGLRLQSEENDGYRTLAIMNDKPVWIEWRDYKIVPVCGESGIFEPVPDPQSIQNVERLTWLLSQPGQPEDLRSPRCLGYVDDSERLRFGLVLECFSGRSRSLLSWFDEPRLGIGGRLIIARQLSESLLYLHAVNWLHKGLRSAGIVFCETASGPIEDVDRLLVSGFGFSRPSDHSFTTDGPPHDSKWSLYCHPGYLDSGRKTGYRKSYDIYSLGIILIEIAHWKPIDQILQPPHSGRDSALGEQRQDTRVHILESDKILREVRQNVGGRYADATRACIEGVTAFGLQSGVDESNSYVAALLQQAFIEVVVDPLKGIVI